MNKLMVFLSRTVLALGVLIALTPCSICKASMGTNPAMAQCSMKGHNCCHAKKKAPFCKVMDQSSVPSSTVSLDVPVLGPSVLALVPAPVRVTGTLLQAVFFGSSPPRGPLVLRI